MRKIVHVVWLLAAAVPAAGCASTAGSSAGGSPASSSPASARPSGTGTVAPSALTPTATSAAVSTPLDILPVPPTSHPWADNTNAPMKLDAFIDKFYDTDSQAAEKSLYAQRGFVSGAYEGWFNADGSQQSIAIARFSTASGATYAFGDLSGSLRQDPAPSKVFTDSVDGAVGSQDPKLDSQGNAFVDITAHVGDYLVDVHEYSAATPNISAAKALLLKQVQALKTAS
jgi:hypothetical protein